MGEESVDSLSAPETTEQGGNLAEESVDPLSTLEKTEQGGNLGEESVDSLSSPEKTEQGGNTVSSSNECGAHSDHHSASIVSHHAGDSSTRNSEKSDSSNSGRTRNMVVPHYLRASTGSCHDFCKYGRKHSFEEKPRKPIRRRVAQSLPNELYPDIQVMVSGDKGKKKAVDHKPTTDAKSHSPKSKTSLDKEKVVNSKASPDIKNNSPDPTSTNTKIALQKPRNPKMFSDVKTYSPRLRTSSGSQALLLKHRPSTKKLPSSEPPEVVKSVFFPTNKRVEDPAKEGSLTDNKKSRAEKNTSAYPSFQRPSLVKSKSLNPNRQSFSQGSDGKNGKGGRNSDVATDRNTASPKTPAKKVSATPAATLSPILKAPHVNSGKTGNSRLTRMAKTKTSNNEKVPEKTLHVVKTETNNNVSDPIHDGHAMSSSSSHAKFSSLSSSHEEVNEETEHSDVEGDEAIMNPGKVPPPVRENNNHKKTLRKNKVMVVSEDNKSCSPVKLKFRSGKVVDIQSENNGPRRLRFRRARILGLEDKGDSRRRTLKKAGGNGDKTNSEMSSEKVVLKHQDVQGKKDAQGLFNNVIEETASKLVESRKSKVKALVGAFETVISLQESKPSTQAVS